MASPSVQTGEHGARVWRSTALSGVALLFLVTAHMVANHFVVQEVGGLRTYAQVLDYIGNPLMFVIECLFLVVVTIHALLGVRAVLFDFGLSARAQRLISRGLVVLGTVTIAYGFVLVGVLAARS
jgi:succinate dehydrogenase hydrophobic anchor subunit